MTLVPHIAVRKFLGVVKLMLMVTGPLLSHNKQICCYFSRGNQSECFECRNVSTICLVLNK